MLKAAEVEIKKEHQVLMVNKTTSFKKKGKGKKKGNFKKNNKQVAVQEKKLHTDGLLEPLDYESLGTCEPCLMGKMTKTPFSGTMQRSNDLLEIIHTDVCGPTNVEARGGYRYFLTFTDDLSRYGYIYLINIS